MKLFLKLIRINQTEKVTTGKLLVKDLSTIVKEWASVELPDLNNARNISRIPAGTYECEPIIRPNGDWAISIKNVPNRSHILIHKGNYTRDIQGCILIGKTHADIDSDGIMDVTSSAVAMGELRELIDQPTIIIIEDEYNEPAPTEDYHSREATIDNANSNNNTRSNMDFIESFHRGRPSMPILIKHGDVLSCQADRLISLAIRFVTGSEVNHTAVVDASSGRLCISESQKRGVSKILTYDEWAKKYKYRYIIHRPKEWTDEHEARLKETQQSGSYDYPSLLLFQPILQLTGVWLGRRNERARNRLYCSEKAGYVAGLAKSWKLSPDDVYMQLSNSEKWASFGM